MQPETLKLKLDLEDHLRKINSPGQLQSLATKLDFYRTGKTELVIVEGLQAIKHLLHFARPNLLLLLCEDKLKLKPLAQKICPDLVKEVLNSAIELGDNFEKLCKLEIRTKVMAIAIKKPTNLSLVLEDLKNPTKSQQIVFLEDPHDLGNVGAVIRVAAARACSAVCVSGELNPWNFAAIRGGAGLQFAVPTVNLSLSELAQLKLPIYAFDAGGQDLLEAVEAGNIQKPCILAFGTERSGISPKLKKESNGILAIPMQAGVSSLNLATSVAVAVYA